MNYPPEPTSDQCSTRHIDTWEGQRTLALWYPQMGGYCSKCIVVNLGGCFDAYIWHDGQFPFGSEDGPPPARLHHCVAEQFITFGQIVADFIPDPEPSEED